MGWFWWGGRDKDSIRAAIAKEKRCKSFLTGLEGCRKANPGPQQQSVCKHMEQRLVTCLAEIYEPALADIHRRCYTKVYKTGSFEGSSNCKTYEDAMAKALRKRGLHPV